jgi:hypothetical protein
MMKKILITTLFLWGHAVRGNSTDTDHSSCQPLKSKVIYTIEKDDFLSDILQTFELTPLWGKSHFVKKSLKINGLNDPDLIISGNKLEIPFRCEEDAQRFSLLDQDGIRFIDSKKLVKVKTIKVSDKKMMVFQYPDGSRKPYLEGKIDPPKYDALETNPKTPLLHRGEKSSVDEVNKSKLKTNYSISLLSGFKKISSTDLNTHKDSTLLSDPLIGAQINLSLGELQKLRGGFFYQYQSIKFIQDDSTPLKNAQNSLNFIGTYLERNYPSLGTLRLKAQYGEYLFLTGSTSSGVMIKKFWRPSIGLDYAYSFFKKNSLNLSLLTSYQSSFSGKHQGQELRTGHGPSLGTNLNTTIFSRPVDFSIIYSIFFQESQDYEQRDHHIGLSSTINF